MAWLSQRGYLTACVMFFAGWCLLGAPWLSGAVTIPYDAKAHFQAQVQFLAHAIHSGQSPFWTPNVFAGSPQIADPQSLIFSPALLLALINPSPSFRAVDALVLITLGFGGLAVIGFFRDRGWHPAGAVVAALAFAFGASAAWRIQHVGQIDSYAFFAVTLWLLARSLDRASWAWGLAAGLSAGLMVVKPDQVGFLGAFILAGYIVDHFLRAPSLRGEIARAAPPLAAATVIGALIVAAPLLLTFLFASDSNRPDFGFVEATRGSLHPASLLTSVIADLFGAFDPKVEYWGPSSSAWDPNDLALAQNMGQVYLGALPVLAIIAAGLARGALFARPMRFFTVALALVTVYALGRHTPAFHWIFNHVPGVSFFRRPADATFMIGALGAIMAGYCVHDWLTRPVKLPAIVTGLATIIPIALIAALSLVIAARVGRFDAALAPVLSSLAWLAAAFALMIVVRHANGRAAALAIVIPAALLVADLRIHNGPNESTALPPAHYDVLDPATKNETIRFLKERIAQKGPSDRRDRVELVGLGFAWPNAGLVHGFDHTLGYNPFRLAAFSEASGAGDGIAGPKEKNFTAIFPRYNCRLANLLGLRYVVSSVPIEQVDTHFRVGDLQLIERTADGYIYENPRARPRVMFAREWRLTDFDAIMESGRWPEFDPAKTVLLDSDPAADHPDLIAPAGSNQIASVQTGAPGDKRLAIAILPPRPSEAPPSKVSIARYENTEIEITIEAGQAGFVVLNDVWHPWWTATLDGKPAPILKANVLFRAVQTPAGKHTLRFSFKPLDGALAELAERLKDDE